LIACLSLCLPLAAQAEEGWQWELASDIAFPSGKLGPAKLKSGPGFDLTISYGLTPKLGSYVGWNWHRFRADSAFTGSKVDANESGLVLGMQWRDRFGQSGLDYRVRAGIVFNQIELESSSGIISDSKHGVGWELAAALLVPLPGHWTLTPGVRYRSLSRDITVGGQSYAVGLRYVAVGAGVSVRF
jgi:Outer membrane protein beta-barrel domain